MSVRKLVFLSMMLALATCLGIAESFIPMYWIPGMKPGLANIVIVLLLYVFSWKEALVVDILRVLLVGALRGSILQMSFLMSLGGAALSFLFMFIAYKFFPKFSVVGVSIIGALFHDLGQILVGWAYLGSAGVFYYLPFMALVSLATGLLVGLVSQKIIKSGVLNKIKGQEDF